MSRMPRGRALSVMMMLSAGPDGGLSDDQERVLLTELVADVVPFARIANPHAVDDVALLVFAGLDIEDDFPHTVLWVFFQRYALA
jgi:hypothetical protein